MIQRIQNKREQFVLNLDIFVFPCFFLFIIVRSLFSTRFHPIQPIFEVNS